MVRWFSEVLEWSFKHGEEDHMQFPVTINCRNIAEADGSSVHCPARWQRLRETGTLLLLDEARQPIGVVIVVTEREERAVGVVCSGLSRRLPVVDRCGKLVGVLNLDGLPELLTEEPQQIDEPLDFEIHTALTFRDQHNVLH